MKKTIQKVQPKGLPKRLLSFFAIALTLLVSIPLQMQPAQAAALTTAYTRLSRQQADVTSGISLTAFWKPASTATENKFQIIFPDADDGLWCRTAGSLTFATTSIDSASDPTASAGTCSQGSGASSYDTFNFTTADLTPGTLYGVVITGNTAVIGTASAGAHVTTMKTRTSVPADIDTLDVALRTIADDQVSVSAAVVPTLTVTLSTTTSVSLGTLDTSNVNQASMTSTVVTNAPNGYASTVLYDATLTSGVNTIPDATGGTIAPAGSEFGASTDDSTSVDLAATSNSCASGTGTYNATALTTSAQVFASESSAQTSDVTTLCFVAGTSATQQAGTYTSTVTLVTTGKF